MDAGGAEVGVLQDALEEAEVGLDAADEVFVEGAEHAVDCGLARGSICDQLREHGVVFEWDLPAFVDGGVLADAGAGGLDEAGDLAG